MGKQQKAAKSNASQQNQIAKPQKNNQNFKNKNISKPNDPNQSKKQNKNLIASKTNNAQNKIKVQQQQQNQKPITDQRFAKASYDPRFLRPKKEMTKVKIDNRFSKMLTDPAFQNLSKVDKYGRKIADLQIKKKQNEELKQFYTKEDQQINQQYDEQQQDNDENIDLQNGSEMDEQAQNDQERQQSEGEVNNLRKWMEQYDEESSSLADMPVQEMLEDEQKQIPEVWSDDQQNVIKNPTVKATKRLALCNYDWMNITSKDLMILFNSFKPPTGLIKSIKVYQSNFGKERMEQEEVFGPQGIWNDQEQVDQFQDQQNKKSKKWRKSWKELLKKQNSSALDSAKLRAYEKERLKYFYAVIECDNKKTADEIYKQCDGNQFESSNLQFDLRFIPDDISFDITMLKEQCKQMPVSGQVKNFINRAMGHSKVQLTWQDPELSLPASLKKKNWGKMTDQQLQKIDWGTYLNEEDVQEDENQQELFLQKDQNQIIPDWKKQCNKKYRNQNEGEKLVISFDSGFGPSKSEKKPKIQSQVPSLKKQKKSKKQLWQRAEQERKKRREELALMTENQDQQKEKNFKVDLQDDRFKAVYENPLFSIDPSNPKFDHRRAGNVFKQVVKRNKDKHLE